ncbi:MAG TPA: hypothetical protein VFV93_04850 [Thermomicrobiales bacterium]|nr:hypothetical protein [Thermomicrobiales bacterium]
MRNIVAGLALVLLLAGCGIGGNDEPASDATSRLIDAFSKSDYATAYDMLHSAQRKLIDEQVFIDCDKQREMSSPAKVDSYEITGSVKRSRDVARIGDKEVTEVGANLTQGTNVSYRTWDMLKDGGEWSWVLSADDLNAFQEGRCPG